MHGTKKPTGKYISWMVESSPNDVGDWDEEESFDGEDKRASAEALLETLTKNPELMDFDGVMMAHDYRIVKRTITIEEYEKRHAEYPVELSKIWR